MSKVGATSFGGAGSALLGPAIHIIPGVSLGHTCEMWRGQPDATHLGKTRVDAVGPCVYSVGTGLGSLPRDQRPIFQLEYIL